MAYGTGCSGLVVLAEPRWPGSRRPGRPAPRRWPGPATSSAGAAAGRRGGTGAPATRPRPPAAARNTTARPFRVPSQATRRTAGPDRQRVGIGQRDAARRGQRHLPRADHERGQASGRSAPGRPRRPDASGARAAARTGRPGRCAARSSAHEHEDGLGQRPDRCGRRERAGCAFDADDRVGRASRRETPGRRPRPA